MINTPTSPPPGAPKLTDEEIQQQVERIVHSATLRGSTTLQQLFQYLVSRSLEGAADSLKEYTIGLEAFGRRTDFDPRTDTIVRVQTHRLRQKLKDYYQDEGVHDRVMVEIPKGHYCPVSRLRDERNDPETESPKLLTLGDHDPDISTREGGLKAARQVPGSTRLTLFRPAIVALTFLFALALGYLAGRFWRRSSNAPSGPSAVSVSDPVKAFWASFLQGDRAPIIAYPNAVFLLDDSNDLLRFRQGASDSRGARVDEHLAQQFASNPTLVKNAGPLYYEDGYTGTGELQGVAMLTEVFAEMGVKPIIKTSRNITPEDLQEHSVILLGSPFQNVAVGKLFADGDFSFDNPDSHREQWRAMILNAHPQKDEASSYHTERDPKTQVLEMDFSLISVQPGVVKGHRIAVLGGLDTKGTEGATKFMTTSDGISGLTTALSAKGIIGPKAADPSSQFPYFQALLRVQLDKGDQVLRTELTSVHPLPAKSTIPDPDDATAAKK
ncbi:MAG TPA: hypothetical protein VFE27_25060 [Acidobacteriaceae bacterium]|nr:hypothetical protein [Acidobacteriaceae bacterium]